MSMTISDIRGLAIRYTGDPEWVDTNIESRFDQSCGWTYRRCGDSDWLKPEWLYDQLIEDFCESAAAVRHDALEYC